MGFKYRSREFLRASEYELEPCRLDGTTVWRAMRGEQEIRFNVDIEFDYFGMAKDQPQHYSAKYEFDPKNPTILKKL